MSKRKEIGNINNTTNSIFLFYSKIVCLDLVFVEVFAKEIFFIFVCQKTNQQFFRKEMKKKQKTEYL